MPILICIGMAVLFYIVLNRLMGNLSLSSIGEKQENSHICPQCNKDVNSNWRYCPFCGFVKEDRFYNAEIE